ncbi:hypothetical protein Fuma_06054 [Fuerstiella marisgermanici]|uniref:Uncharacterized protein n=1 Tax=Fuerstiella marisgermanici TaxID=1891926 RepID=A0A1P8WQP2_9PLAN|nr:hypothetical protein Fuma_06054 [Fuerstiella marisgermanici]
MTLYALLEVGSNDQHMISRRIRFLIKSQKNEGSWPVSGTKEKKRNGVEETASYWGTTWTVIAPTRHFKHNPMPLHKQPSGILIT